MSGEAEAMGVSGLRPELVGKRFELIEFCLERLHEVRPETFDADMAVVNEWQDIEVRLCRDFDSAAMIRTGELARVCRGVAVRYADHPDFDKEWKP